MASHAITHRLRRSHAGKEVFLLKRRRGLVKIALQTGALLVPVVCFGNTRAVRGVEDGLGVMRTLSRLLGISIIYPAGRFGLPIPHRSPITIVIGKPLALTGVRAAVEQPEEAEVDRVHQDLMREMSEIYFRWRDAAGYAGVELQIV